MKKRKKMIKRAVTLFLASAVLLTCSPVYGQEAEIEFVDGIISEDTDFFETEEFPSESEIAFTDGKEDTEKEDSTAENSTAENSGEENAGDDNGIHYIKGRPLTEEERAEQLAPIEQLKPLSEVPSIGINSGNTAGYSAYRLYPEKFDARKAGIVTEAKNQNPFGICWAFGMASLMETSLLSQNEGAYDLSEEHLAYFFANRENDPLGNTPFDKNRHLGNYHWGGNNYLASLFLTTWSGMTTEESVPLPTNPENTEDLSCMIPPEKAYEAAAYLTDASFSDYTPERMKEMLLENNSASIMYYMDSAYHNPDTGGYSYPQKRGINHVVVIVGWDDTYSKENFCEASGVTSDGAWIAKNSWGPQWGENGYFYLSYEDKNISGLVSAKAADRPEYENNYFYDGSSGLQTIVLSPKQSVANIFMVKAGKGKNEILGEVNVSTFSENGNYSIQVYTDLKDHQNPVSGTPAYEKPIACYQPFAGVKTVKIPEVPLLSGTEYSVVVTNTGDEKLKFCCETNAGYNGWVSCEAGVGKGQGFFGTTTGNWSDLYSAFATPRIKAHTKTTDWKPAPTPTPKPTLKKPVFTVRASADGYNKITWSKVDGATGYSIYRKVPSGRWVHISNVKAPGLKYYDKRVSPNASYIYTVKAYHKTSKEFYTSKYTTGDVIKTAPAHQKISSAASESSGIRLKWRPQTKCDGYRIYRKTKNGSWRTIKTISSGSVSTYLDKTPRKGVLYYYAVRAYVKEPYGNVYSRYTASKAVKRK